MQIGKGMFMKDGQEEGDYCARDYVRMFYESSEFVGVKTAACKNDHVVPLCTF